jgi:hypothetical protein
VGSKSFEGSWDQNSRCKFVMLQNWHLPKSLILPLGEAAGEPK